MTIKLTESKFSSFTTTHNTFVFTYSNNSLSITNYSKLDKCSYKLFSHNDSVTSQSSNCSSWITLYKLQHKLLCYFTIWLLDILDIIKPHIQSTCSLVTYAITYSCSLRPRALKYSSSACEFNDFMFLFAYKHTMYSYCIKPLC